VRNHRESDVAKAQAVAERPSRTKAVFWTILIFLSTNGCATFAPGAGGTLQDEINEIILQPPVDQVNWGIRIVDPERGQILYSRHAHLKFVPASNMKLLSTSAALSLLGPDFRYQTDLLAVGPLEDDGATLAGDLLLRPSGDPTFSERFYPSAEAPLDSLAQGVWEAGVRTVTGSLVVDVSGWDSTSVPGTWEVEDLTAAFASTGGAFSIAEGTMTLEVTGGAEPGAEAQARWWPYVADDFVNTSFTTVPADSSTRGRHLGYLPESRRHEISGVVRVSDTDTIRFSQRDPVRVASQGLLLALEHRGIEVRGGVRIVWNEGETLGPEECLTHQDCPGSVHLAGLTSPPLGEIVKGILEPSQNWMTEQLVRTLGAEMGEKGSWEEGFRVQREFFIQDVGVDSLDLVLRDGSGISAKNLVTPRALVRILDYMRDSDNAGIFRHALASPGEEESTLRSRLPELESRVFAKTGTITHVNSLSGYVFTDSGRELIFSILSNGSGLPSSVVRAAIDKITQAVARH
jgi:D-alanyl-D-alanine carboxypeptidase/D-alanyl-D-alanine-endopeptidase (penicillin-binding protein 4)